MENGFVLDYFGVEAPRVITSAKAERVQSKCLGGPQWIQQSVSNIAEVEGMVVVYHLRCGPNFSCQPTIHAFGTSWISIFCVYHVQRTRCSSAKRIGLGLMFQVWFQILFFEISNNTPHLIVIAPELAELAGVNLEEYGLAILKAEQRQANPSKKIDWHRCPRLLDWTETTFVWLKWIQLILRKFWDAKLKSKQLSNGQCS